MKHCLFVAVSTLCCLISFPLLAEDSCSANPLCGRTNDPVTIQGDQLPLLLDKDLERLELLIVNREGNLEPIPFQVDERVEIDGGVYAWVLPEGPKGGAVQGNGALDAQDEVVFMARDLGGQGAVELLKQLPPLSMEIRVTDPVTGKAGFAYLCFADQAPRRSTADYVTYDVARDLIDTPVYIVGHSKAFPIAHNQNTIKVEAGGQGLNLIDIFKQRLRATALFGTLRLEKTAEDWTSQISAYKDGPVRVIRRNENRLYLSKRIRSPELYTHTFYYRSFFFLPGEIDVPFKLSLLITSLEISLATDFCRNAVGMQFTSNSVDVPVLVDGVLSPQERLLDRSVNQTWQMVHGAQGTWLNRIVLGPGLEGVLRGLLYEDDATRPDPPEEEEGIIGMVGLALSNLEQLKGGQYTFSSYIYFPEHFVPEDFPRIMDILDRPLEVATRRVTEAEGTTR